MDGLCDVAPVRKTLQVGIVTAAVARITRHIQVKRVIGNPPARLVAPRNLYTASRLAAAASARGVDEAPLERLVAASLQPAWEVGPR